MRLIDADDLIAHTFKNDISYKAFVNLVKKQQTIEERKTGKWEWVEEKVGTFLETGRTIFDAHSKCSECGARAFDDMVDDEFLTPYCPQCGARMENGDD